jgi:glycosyltransferase involved in cell wall biosynthesis
MGMEISAQSLEEIKAANPPVLTVCLFTYNRLDYAIRTLRSTLGNIRYTRGPIHVHIADDGSCEGYVDALWKEAADHYVAAVTATNAERRGYGASYNLATQAVHTFSTYILPLEDDWELLRALDLDTLTEDLDYFGFPGRLEYNQGACIRLGYMGWTRRLDASFIESGSGRKYLWLDSASPEPHVFAGGPRIETVAWERHVGEWPEGLNPGDTELAVATRRNARDGVLWPLDLVKTWGDLYAHIGTIRSYDV